MVISCHMSEPSYHGDVFTALIVEIFRLNALILDAGDRIAQPVGLTSARWQILGVVEHGPVPVAHVARYMRLSRQTVQQTANGLEREGFIQFVDNPHHRRAKLMRITEKGETALTYVRARQAVWAQQIAGEHSLESLEQALEVLRGLKHRLEQNKPTGGKRLKGADHETEPSQSDGH